MLFNFLTVALCASLAFSSPTPKAPSRVVAREAQAPQATDIVLAIVPKSKDCTNPPTGSVQGECATYQEASGPLVAAMAKYNIQWSGEIAAIIANMGFESVDFKYNHNVSPGRPGQGTRSMQMANFNLEYALSIAKDDPAFKASLDAVTTATSIDGLGPDILNKILALVQPNQYSFGSGAWYYKTKCSSTPGLAMGLATGTDAGWAAYMSCLGVASTPEREAYWKRAKTAFGI